MVLVFVIAMISSSSPKLDVKYSTRELSKADIDATVYGGYNSNDGFDSSRVSSVVDWR